MIETKTAPTASQSQQGTRPRYEAPRIQVMTEKEILNTFQITQAMGTWWVMC